MMVPEKTLKARHNPETLTIALPIQPSVFHIHGVA